jgi:hypothetical protein
VMSTNIFSGYGNRYGNRNRTFRRWWDDEWLRRAWGDEMRGIFN